MLTTLALKPATNQATATSNSKVAIIRVHYQHSSNNSKAKLGQQTAIFRKSKISQKLKFANLSLIRETTFALNLPRIWLRKLIA
jgi:hypothetical protein